MAAQFGWPTRKVERDDEVAVVALTETDPSFERFIWVYDLESASIRFMLVSKVVVPEKEQPTILELCAWINQGLLFGCAEYSFKDRVVVFRDSAEPGWAPLDYLVKSTTSRVLNLGSRYSKAIQDTLNGKKPQDAVEKAED